MFSHAQLRQEGPTMHSQFTLYFDGSFWVGVYEVHFSDGTVQAARYVFGGEPSDAELWAWTLVHGMELIDRAHAAPRITPSASTRLKHVRSPKRMARLAARESASPRTSTAAQEALARARDEQKTSAKAARTRRREEEAQARYEQRAAKRRKKRRGH